MKTYLEEECLVGTHLVKNYLLDGRFPRTTGAHQEHSWLARIRGSSHCADLDDRERIVGRSSTQVSLPVLASYLFFTSTSTPGRYGTIMLQTECTLYLLFLALRRDEPLIEPFIKK